nr:hypothetical protein [uncultured Allomuricauda sp.]
MKEYILTRNKGKISLEQLIYGMPSKMLVFNEQFMKFCFQVANYQNQFEGDLEKVYTNLLFLKSDKVKILYYLSDLDKEGHLKEINIDFISRKNFGHLFSNQVRINGASLNGNLLTRQILPKLFLKYFANKVFFIFKAKVRKEKVIKAWVEITEKIYKDELKNAQILIYPFPLKIHRQLLYVYKKAIRREKIGLMGVPYRIAPLLKSVFSKDYDYHISVFEHLGAIKQADYFINHSIAKKILTTEEFEVGSYTFSKRLAEGQIEVINSCHGLSVYSPFVSFTKFNLINKKQQQLYSVFNEGLNFEIMYSEDCEPGGIPIRKIIFVDQGNLTKFGLHYEAVLREKTLTALNQLGEKNNFPIEIKTHPNTKQKEIKRIQTLFENLTLIKTLDTTAKETVFITLYSTAYYDFRRIGKFIFIKDDLFDPSLFFGPEINTVHIANLKSNLEQLTKHG